MLFGFDPIYLGIIGVGIVISLVASAWVKSRFIAGKATELASRMTGADVARRILHENDVHDVEVVEHQGFLSDHYNPMEKKLALSPDVYHGTHAAAAGVAAHEVGHALQHAHGLWHMWLRSILVYPAYFGSNLGPLLIIAGIMLAGGQALAPGSLQHTLALVGVGAFGISTLCAFIIVHNEFNASSQARAQLVKLGITRPGEEDATVRSVLNAAGMTYLAAAVISLIQLLYWAWRAGLIGGQRRD
jgi:hypothetical protein